jgi:hypothetical protein
MEDGGMNDDDLMKRARSIEARVNAELAKLGPQFPDFSDPRMDEIISSLVPDNWDWIDVTRVGGPPELRLVGYRGQA